MASGWALKNHEILGRPASYEVLTFAERHSGASVEELTTYISKDGFWQTDVDSRIKELESVGFLSRYGSNKIRLTEEGLEALVLIDVINGDPLTKVFDRLPSLRLNQFSLITHDITGFFLSALSNRRDFTELSLCSPWIRLERADLDHLGYILESSKKLTGRPPKIRILTRFTPVGLFPYQNRWSADIYQTLRWFLARGADIICHPSLHAKLHIIWGIDYQMAIFGSENLTGAHNIELAVCITDSIIVNKLYSYWEYIQNDPKCFVLREEMIDDSHSAGIGRNRRMVRTKAR